MRYLAAFCFAAVAAAGPLPPASLRCEYLSDPIGIDVTAPRFYWVLTHTERGARQTAYQVLVSAAPGAANGDEWDSGKIVSDSGAHVVYAGKPLQSGRTYYWKVRYWDRQDQASSYSAPSHFEMGMLTPSDWKAGWLRGGNMLRKEFTLAAAPVRARAYVSGIGYYEFHVNGAKIGDHVLDPAFTQFSKRILYATYDVTSQLHQGANAVGMMLGEGWYHARAGLLQLEIDLAGGSHVRIVTDGNWKVIDGPVLADSIYNGETYDARKEIAGWDRPGLDTSAWKSASLENQPTGVLSAQMMPPMRVVADLVPRKLTQPRPGVYVFDMGQNFSGWTRLRVRGPAGARVVMRHAELIYDDGTINTENLRAAKATDTYTLRGDPDGEVYEPRFTYHGYRYVEVTGYPGTPSIDSVTGREVHTDVQATGGFSASKAMLNQLQQNILWGVKSNLHSIPTDCDQRDERRGWMADAHLAAETAMLNFDMAAFYTNWLRGIHDDQREDGAVPDYVPGAANASPADPAWGAAYPLLVKYMYEQYGDRRIVEQHFEGLRRWADFLDKTAGPGGILKFSKYGDWVPIEKTPGDLVSTAYLYESQDIVAKLAEVLGKKEEANRYKELAASTASTFEKQYYHPDTHTYADGTQTASVLPLFFGITPARDRGNVVQELFNAITYGKNTHLTTGILGTKYVLPLLTQSGHVDLAYDLATQTTYPSWGYMIERGATTIWELWQEVTGPAMNSHNHPMFGSIGAWFYTALAGIQPDWQSPGYQRVLIAPQMTRDLNYASGSIQTVRGTITSTWSRSPGHTKLSVTVPTGVTAEIRFPLFNDPDLTIAESGHTVWAARAYVPGVAGVTAARRTGGNIVFEAGSGTYIFETQ